MLLPKRFEELPPHEAQVLSAEERSALPPLTWQKISQKEPAPLKAESEDGGCYYIGSQREGGDPQVDLSYTLGHPLGIDGMIASLREKVDVKTWQGYKNLAYAHRQQLGYVLSQEAAQNFWDFARRQAADVSVQGLLDDHGFRTYSDVSETCRIYRRHTKSGMFSLVVRPTGVNLQYEKNSATHWENLMGLHFAEEAHDDQRMLPLFWPPEVANPRTAVIEAAVRLSHEWTPVSSWIRRAKM